MDRDDPVEQGDHHENQKPESEVVQECVEIDVTADDHQDAGEGNDAEHHRRNNPFADPKE